MPQAAGRRRPYALSTRIETFYLSNPDEWMSLQDLSARFRYPIASVRRAIDRIQHHTGLPLRAVVVYRMERTGSAIDRAMEDAG